MHEVSPTGWRRPMGCLKLQVIFHKRATNYIALLQKMTYRDIRHPMGLRHPIDCNAKRCTHLKTDLYRSPKYMERDQYMWKETHERDQYEYGRTAMPNHRSVWLCNQNSETNTCEKRPIHVKRDLWKRPIWIRKNSLSLSWTPWVVRVNKELVCACVCVCVLCACVRVRVCVCVFACVCVWKRERTREASMRCVCAWILLFVHICVRVCVYMCMYACVRIRVCVYTCVYVCMCAYMCVCVCVCVYVCVYVCMCVYMCVRVCTCVYVCPYVCTCVICV